MDEPLLDHCPVITIYFDNSIGDNSSWCPANVANLVFNGFDVTSDFSDLRKNQRLVKSLNGINWHIVSCSALYLADVYLVKVNCKGIP